MAAPGFRHGVAQRERQMPSWQRLRGSGAGHNERREIPARIRENEEERPEEARPTAPGVSFCGFPPPRRLTVARRRKSHPRLDFGFAWKSRGVAPLRVSTFRSGPTHGEDACRRPRFTSPVSHGFLRAPCLLSVSPPIYHQDRGPSSAPRAQRQQRRWLTLSDLARLYGAIAIPWHAIMKIYRELTEGVGSSRRGWLIARPREVFKV